MATLEQYFAANHDRYEKELSEWLRMASVSTDPAFKDEVNRAANWLADRFRSLNFKTELISTVGHPIVYAESPTIPDVPTVLVYGHYDVQPPDPLNEWISPPFEPTIRDGKIYARGATDDKGQMITHFFGAEAWIKTHGRLPVNLKFLIEGEEECGSKGLYEFLAGKYDTPEKTARERISADIVVISDNSQYGPGQPAVTYGLRGIAYFELRLTGPKQDLHSGTYGGAVTNPANTLTRMLSSLIDSEGRIQVPGFYDDIVELSDTEREQYSNLNFDEKAFFSSVGVEQGTGEVGYTTLERRWARPTFDINGLWSGYQGDGAKTILPARAGAKFSFRLVAKQCPKKIQASLRTHLEKICPPGIKLELIDMHGAPGSMVPLDSPYMAAAASAIEKGFGKDPVFIRAGGSIPVVNAFAERAGIDTLLLGWGQDDDNLHSPNEKFLLADFHRGIATSAHLWEEISKIKPK
jgi:acetylornithine deacetylase/succinyl-diaminopimelate desuccinylase-like protein